MLEKIQDELMNLLIKMKITGALFLRLIAAGAMKNVLEILKNSLQTQRIAWICASAWTLKKAFLKRNVFLEKMVANMSAAYRKTKAARALASAESTLGVCWTLFARHAFLEVIDGPLAAINERNLLE